MLAAYEIRLHSHERVWHWITQVHSRSSGSSHAALLDDWRLLMMSIWLHHGEIIL